MKKAMIDFLSAMLSSIDAASVAPHPSALHLKQLFGVI